ncbi:GntR family transcriptional regulator [Pseudomonas sp. RTC3]|uniref:GntR family transcriptional regulator n=1 Tax=unclassified Pseudomonas TaxID=196821 RepID=UPI002AB4A4EB|nr:MULTISPECIES: GntR family transcriptional regulator [unclassified Pseudomonas]MEB0060847.1 GntR family transcriptional regulator [Pseudomonas sp. RTC3]MDY7563928.1 GntR family transcriptional regulator [Pseudomonas sp. 5C2]MEB0005972.1 GntR family transcriptional regulator [Pseudomonas sp. RTB2]MEB0018937.1 GntR family transcriptional regulator [Pseudomonas sp. RTB3]MEB0025556.1 GntR family transcriptional regulator [Pseudomonas sp. MH9.2]
MSYPFDAITHTYLGSNVYSKLRNALITGGLKPDDRLRIRELASQLGTSVTPVRDAILQLAKEKALVLKTPKDIRVPVLDSAAYLEIRTLRLNLEGLGAETAARLATSNDLKRIDANIQLNLEAINNSDLPEALRLNSEFHFLIAEAARMPLLRSYLDSLWMRAGPLIAQAYVHFSLTMAIEHHVEVLNALRQQDAAAAKHAIQADILDGNQKMLEFIAVNQEAAS